VRTWTPEPEPDDVSLVEDANSQLWQHCRDFGWQQVDGYVQAGLERVGLSWGRILGDHGPLTEVDPDDPIAARHPGVGGRSAVTTGCHIRLILIGDEDGAVTAYCDYNEDQCCRFAKNLGYAATIDAVRSAQHQHEQPSRHV
jgi:hypothetical protein